MFYSKFITVPLRASTYENNFSNKCWKMQKNMGILRAPLAYLMHLDGGAPWWWLGMSAYLGGRLVFVLFM